MRLLHRLGNDRAWRNLEEAPLMREGVLRPHARDNRDGLLPHRLRLFGINAEALHLDQRGGATGAQFGPPIAEDVEHRGALGDANGMVILGGSSATAWRMRIVWVRCDTAPYNT